MERFLQVGADDAFTLHPVDFTKLMTWILLLCFGEVRTESHLPDPATGTLTPSILRPATLPPTNYLDWLLIPQNESPLGRSPFLSDPFSDPFFELNETLRSKKQLDRGKPKARGNPAALERATVKQAKTATDVSEAPKNGLDKLTRWQRHRAIAVPRPVANRWPNSSVALGALSGIALISFLFSWTKLDHGERLLVYRLGRLRNEREREGIYFHWFPFYSTRRISTRMQRIEIEPTTVLTGDAVKLSIGCSVSFRVHDTRRLVTNIPDEWSYIRETCSSIVAALVCDYDSDVFFRSQNSLSEYLASAANEELHPFGIEVLKLRMTRVEPFSEPKLSNMMMQINP